MKLIKISQDHYVIVDDSEIKEGDHYINIELGNPFFGKIYKGVDRILNEGYSGNGYKNPDYFKTWMKKITHSTKPFEDVGLNTSMGNQLGFDKIEPMYLSEVKELIGEVDVEKKAELYVWGGVYLSEQEKQQTEIAYISGYNQALEDNKEKKYTEEDMINWTMCMIAQYVQGNTNIWNKDLLRESLPTPKKEWEIEIIDGKLQLK